MRYSALVPAFNAEATIGDSIESILQQTAPPAAIVVVDDGSTDRTADIARQMSPLVRVISQENAGAGSATTRGFNDISTPFFATLDADDLWLPEKMQRQLSHFRIDPDCSGAFGHIRLFRGSVTGAGEARPGWLRSTLAFRTDAALRVGGVIDPPGGGRGDMIDWLARARHIGLRLTMLDEVLALRRVRPGSMSYGRDSERDKGYARAAWLASRRRKEAST